MYIFISYIVIRWGFALFDTETSVTKFWIIYFLEIVYIIAYNYDFLVISTFFNTICDPTMAGTFLTVMHSIRNFSGQFTGTLALFLAEFI